MTLNLKPAAASAAFPLPDRFLEWFAAKGWSPRAHQLELLARAEQGQSTLLIAPTGAGKTLAGFLPALVDLEKRGRLKPGLAKRGVHTLYISLESACRRYSSQSDGAGRGNGSRHHHRDTDR